MDYLQNNNDILSRMDFNSTDTVFEWDKDEKRTNDQRLRTYYNECTKIRDLFNDLNSNTSQEDKTANVDNYIKCLSKAGDSCGNRLSNYLLQWLHGRNSARLNFEFAKDLATLTRKTLTEDIVNIEKIVGPFTLYAMQQIANGSGQPETKQQFVQDIIRVRIQ